MVFHCGFVFFIVVVEIATFHLTKITHSNFSELQNNVSGLV